MFQQFKNSIREKNSLALTFNQEVAYDRRKVMFVNIYNPLVLAALEFFKKKHATDTDAKTFEFQLPVKTLARQMNCRQLFMAVFKIEETREIYNQTKRKATLVPILYDVNEQQVIEDDEFADEFLGKVLVVGENLKNPTTKNYDKAFYIKMRESITDCIEAKIEEQREEAKMMIENGQKKREKFVRQHTEIRIERMEKRLEKMKSEVYGIFDEKVQEGIALQIRTLPGQIKKMQEKLESQLQQIRKDQNLHFERELLSLNLVNLI